MFLPLGDFVANVKAFDALLSFKFVKLFIEMLKGFAIVNVEM